MPLDHLNLVFNGGAIKIRSPGPVPTPPPRLDYIFSLTLIGQGEVKINLPVFIAILLDSKFVDSTFVIRCSLFSTFNDTMFADSIFADLTLALFIVLCTVFYAYFCNNNLGTFMNFLKIFKLSYF
jgi:hypothetical protein